MTAKRVGRLQESVLPALEVIAERIGWMPVIFVPTGAPKEAFGLGCDDPDVLALAVAAVARAGEGEGEGEAGANRDPEAEPAQVFPVERLGSVVVLGKLGDPHKAAVERIVKLMRSQLRDQRRESELAEGTRALEATRLGLEEQVSSLELLDRLNADLRAVMAEGSAAGRPRLLVDRLARFAGGAVVLQNAKLIVLADSGDAACEIVLVPSRRQSLRDVVAPLAGAAGTVELAQTGDLPRRLVMPLRARDELFGFLTVAREAEEDTLIRLALEIAAGWLAFEHVLRTESDDDDSYDRDMLLFDLATGNAPRRLPERARRLGFDLSRPSLPCIFVPDPQSPEGAGKLRRLVGDAARAAGSAAGEFLVGVLDDAVVAIVPEQIPSGPSAFCQAVADTADEVSLRVRAGIGSPCHQPADYAVGLRQARWVTEVLSLVSPKATLAAFADLGIYALLFDRHRSAELDDFVARWLGPLMTYDEVHNTDLVATLRSVLDTGGVMTEAAKRLFIHISTLKYRVSRIEELLGVELRNAELAFNLHLACKILAVREALSGDAS